MNELWNQLARRAGMELAADQARRLELYLDLLLETNKTMNLTRIVDRAQAEVQHVGDALTVLPFLPAGELTLADVGSGGGVPGIPLAIARPDVQVTLIEATQKKAAFLEKAASAIGLKNVTVIPLRAEEAGVGELRESFDVVTARAVGALVWLAEWCVPLAKVGGKVIAMKGPRLTEELPDATHALQILGAGTPKVTPVELPGSTGLVIVEIPKTKPTNKKYPRNASVAKGKSL